MEVVGSALIVVFAAPVLVELVGPAPPVAAAPVLVELVGPALPVAAAPVDLVGHAVFVVLQHAVVIVFVDFVLVGVLVRALFVVSHHHPLIYAHATICQSNLHTYIHLHYSTM